jgi:LysM repeat protein
MKPPEAHSEYDQPGASSHFHFVPGGPPPNVVDTLVVRSIYVLAALLATSLLAYWAWSPEPGNQAPEGLLPATATRVVVSGGASPAASPTSGVVTPTVSASAVVTASPSPTPTATATVTATPTVTASATATVTHTATVPPVPTATATQEPTATATITPTVTLDVLEDVFVYIVQAGDTLAGIAARFGVTVEDLVLLNDLEDPDFIFEGQELLIPIYD